MIEVWLKAKNFVCLFTILIYNAPIRFLSLKKYTKTKNLNSGTLKWLPMNVCDMMFGSNIISWPLEALSFYFMAVKCKVKVWGLRKKNAMFVIGIKSKIGQNMKEIPAAYSFIHELKNLFERSYIYFILVLLLTV